MEWFPALTGRRVLYRAGTELTKGAEFTTTCVPLRGAGMLTSENAAAWRAVSRSAYDFIYFSKFARDNCGQLDRQRKFPYFIEQMRLIWLMWSTKRME